MCLFFEWDVAKNASNIRKHGVAFEEARTVFADPLARIIDDPDHSSAGEHRLIILGESDQNRILLVVFVESSEDRMRIISARKATPRERHRYEEGT